MKRLAWLLVLAACGTGDGNPASRGYDVLLAHDVWCAPVQNYEELVADPQVAHNGLFWEVPVGEGEATFLTPGSPITFSSTEVGIRHSVPRSGQHTAEVFGDSPPWER